MENSLENRRKFHRININKHVDLDFFDDSYDNCQVKNLSLGGLFVSGNFTDKQICECEINLLNQAGSNNKTLFSASAQIVWGNDEGLGLQFTSMTRKNYLQLLTTLINNAEQPVIIIHEFPKSCPFEIKGN